VRDTQRGSQTYMEKREKGSISTHQNIDTSSPNQETFLAFIFCPPSFQRE